MLQINNKYSIGSDPLNIIIYEKMVVKSLSRNPNKQQTSNIGKEYDKAIGFFSTTKEALYFMVEHEIKATDLKDYKTVVDKIDELHKDIDSLKLKALPTI